MKRTGLAVLLLAMCFAHGALADPKPLTFAQALERAENNPLARAALFAQRAAQAQRDEALGARWPRLQLTAFLAPVPDLNCDNADCTRTSPVNLAPTFDGIFLGGRLEVQQPLYTFGKLDAAASATEAALKLSAADRERVLGDIHLETARAYFGVGLARELVRMLTDGAQQVEKGKTAIAERLERGDPEVTVQDRLRVAALASEITLRLSEAREKEASALDGLRALLGERDVDVVEGAFVALGEALADDPAGADGYWQRAQRTSPELRMANHGVTALGERARLEKARWWPDLGVLAAISGALAPSVDDPPSAFANDPFNNGRAELAVVLRWSLEPAMQAARVQRAEAEQARAGALRDAARAAVEFAVRDAHRRAVEARVRLRAASEGERSARGWVTAALQADAVGAASAKDLADAYLAYFGLHSRVLQSTYELNLAVAALARASGTPVLRESARANNTPAPAPAKGP